MLTKHIVAAAALFSVIQAHPLAGFRFSANPAWAVKRKLYDLDSLTDQTQKDKLTQGLKDAVTIAKKTLEKMDDERHRDKLEGWFGKENSDDNARELIRQVYKNFVDNDPDGTGADVNGDVIVMEKDYWKPTERQVPGLGDGKTPFCSLKKDGKTGTAYYKAVQKTPKMHFCPKVFERGDLKALTADDCSGLGNLISTNRMTKKFIGANVLHEFMHYEKVGQEALGKRIGDVKYDAFQCHALANSDDQSERERTIVNADTYVWYALHIALTEICGKSFSYPRDERDDNDQNQEWPDSAPESDPTQGFCECNESSCTPESPACCANGSCEFPL